MNRLLTYLLLSMLLLFFNEVKAQHKYIGTVLDETDQPIAGATIKLTMAKLQIRTDREGKFQFATTDLNEQLTISHTAYNTQIILLSEAKNNTLRIILAKKTNQLEEVMVETGYQRIPKDRATGAFAQVDDKVIMQRTSSGNILDRLEGNFSALQMDRRNGTNQINIRGINTLSTALMGPLIIVNDLPFEGDINSINPNDVETVTLLKDAAATSVWGARAGNGVIVIKLKNHGRRKGMTVDFSSNLTMTEKPNLMYAPKMSSAEFIEVERMLFDKGFYNTILNGTNSNRGIVSPVVDALHDHTNGLISQQEVDARIEKYKTLDYRNELLRHVYRNGILSQNNIALSGSGVQSGYRIGIGYDRNALNKKESASQRLVINGSYQLNFWKRFRLESNLMYSNMQNSYNPGLTDYPISVGGGRTNLYPYAQLMDDSGDPLVIPSQYNFRYMESVAARNEGLLDWLYKPLDEFGKSKANNNTNYWNAGLKLSVKLWDNLDITGQYGFEGQLGSTRTLRGQESFFTRDLINRFTQIDKGSVKRVIPFGGVLTNGNNDFTSHKGRIQLNFAQKWNNLHELNFFGGSEVSTRTEESNLFTTYGFDEKLYVGQLVNPVDAYPIYDGLGGLSRIPYTNGFDKRTRRYVSLFGNASYTYKGRYIFSVSGRRDASNLFGVNANNKWNPLWSTGLAWKVSDEAFFPKSNVINGLKLRSTWGHSGNSGGMTTSLPIITYMSGLNTDVSTFPRAIVSLLPNPSLRWEDVRMINVALDATLFNNRISLSADAYFKKSTDLFASDPIDPTYGFSTVRRNVAMASGKGIDIDLNAKIIDGTFKWISKVLFTVNKDNVDKYYGGTWRASTFTSYAGRNLSPVEGKALYPVFSYRFMGLDPTNGDPQGYLKGEVSKDYTKLLADSMQNLIYHGTGIPPYYGSLNQTFIWKSWMFTVNIAYKFGHFFQKETIRYQDLFNGWRTHGDYDQRWQKPGDELRTTVPSMTYPANANRDNFYAYSEENIGRGDVIRLQDLRLQYQWRLAHKYPVQFYASVNNVALLWKANKWGIDPDFNNMPPARNYNLGLSVHF
ncbi:SusC/RagA family TonB-linked outer membrane protein [Sphingobacterium sp. N143]|uniref:SusC/RagA family TonB-linked outer membrane protein n=1 Tax=Sphingobacterium sp. N143 TaxID=2746727 RepID=UPI00257784CC|nr:SusC/RagA family TonB-linked outer membrane protein [Sphingobacterium sp. N143]MDM1295296.1 SusC/RagA family TonB-linked outer membrane protein [Sphingobacterium sp. N143]